ncbi:MAG TPA: hypothetical protein VE619_11065 [Nitrososphaeraceae archaeon]|nr:hypothetical protein [Nitrososphaeraceae archaeon]
MADLLHMMQLSIGNSRKKDDAIEPEHTASGSSTCNEKLRKNLFIRAVHITRWIIRIIEI